ncbi:hypothetical protein GV64_04335 [Endozoicomonas elysicola]|uniref:Uncharacterized protein n=1 Tax=Endozoicomonas elysicola TaxID=305900 RepID=A0A081K7E8_9GAMM|nr:hypothetical protein GV64_04335 [Endozoicomonas elysicola]
MRIGVKLQLSEKSLQILFSVIFVISVVQRLVISASLGKAENHHQRQKQGEKITAAAVAEQFTVIAVMVVRRQIHCQKPQIGKSYKEVSFKNSL